MIRMLMLTVLVLALFSAKFASADFFDDCKQDCATAQTQCVEAISFYDETAIKEEKAACAKLQQECVAKCHVEDAKASDEASEAIRQKAAEEAEKRQKEQEEGATLNGTIKIYKFGD
jgi:hypothetical protein